MKNEYIQRKKIILRLILMLDYQKLQSSAQIPTQVQPPTEWKEVEVELI